MVMIVHGHISDMESTIEAIVAASDFPMSIIIVAVSDGDGDHGKFTNMEILDADDKPLIDINGKKQTRDIVQFVPFQKFKNDYHGFAKEILAEIPK